MFNITCSLQYKITNVSFKAGATARSEKYTVKIGKTQKHFPVNVKVHWKCENVN